MSPSKIASIPEFYNDKTIFVTGASGFVGQALLEKLFRSCPGVKQVYMLIREKKGRDAKERIDAIFSEQIFEKLMKTNPEIKEKVIPIRGDITETGLGLSKEDAELVVENTNVVIHSAATVRFDEPLKRAVTVNVIGTSRMIHLSRQMKNLSAFVHVSTAFSHCPRPEVEEVFYPPPGNTTHIINMIEWLDEPVLDSITPALLKEWPNTYTFTKALAETLIAEEAQDLPVAIVRPSIIGPTWREPFPGWTNSLNGPIALVIGAAKGVIRTMLGSNVSANVVPVDTVNNTILAVAWYTATYRPNNTIIYHSTCPTERTLTWEDIVLKMHPVALRYPSITIYRYPGGSFKKSKLWNRISQIYDHLIPAALADAIYYLRGKRPRFMRLYEKIHKVTSCVEYFTTQEWTFDQRNIEMLDKALLPQDKEEFNFILDELHPLSYWENSVVGTRKYILKESYSNLLLARKKLANLYIVTKLFNALVAIGVFQIVLHQSETARSLWNIAVDATSSLLFF